MKKRIIAFLLSLAVLLTAAILTGVTAADTLPFDDVKQSDWFYNDVKNAYDAGLIKGKSENTFDPRSTMTRAELVTLMSRMAGGDVSGYGSYSAAFSDVNTDSWYADCVGWAARVGLVNGYSESDGELIFKPDSPILRQEIAALMVRFIDYMDKPMPFESEIDSYTDNNKIPNWAANDIDSVRMMGLMNGDERGNFNPNQSLTRAECAAVFARLYNKLSIDPMYAALDRRCLLGESEEDAVVLYFRDSGEFTKENLECSFLQGTLALGHEKYELNVNDNDFSKASEIFTNAQPNTGASVSLRISIKNKRTGEETDTENVKFSLVKDGVTPGYSVPEFKYIVKPDGTAEISGYTGSKNIKHIIIPAIVGECIVTSIGDTAFAEARELKSVEISSGIEEIGCRAFALCTSLESAVIPDTVTNAERAVFYYCENLERVRLSASLERIPDYMFYMCTSLSRIVLPESLTETGAYSFVLCPLETLVIPENTEKIGDYSFEGAQFSSVRIPDKCTYVGSWAFYNCDKLTYAVLGRGITKLGSGIFYNTAIESVNYRGSSRMFEKIETRQSIDKNVTIIFGF